jgi:hypothetical protein
MLRRSRYVTTAQLAAALAPLNQRINLMATQADVDAITTQVTQVATDLATAKTDLQAEIDKLAKQNPAIDLTALQGAVAPLDAAVVALETLAPTPPA